MFTPNRTLTPGASGSAKRRAAPSFNLTPRRTQASGLTNRRPQFYNNRSSPADASMLQSPSVAAVFNTENYIFDTAGLSLPVLVKEAITIGKDSAEISVEFDENGWAWLVCDRKLFVWRYKQGVSKQLCKEFLLPSIGASESPHRASLVLVGKSTDSRDDGIVSLLTVTSSGNVRFWPNIVQDTTTALEACLDGIGGSSVGEQCLKVERTQGHGFLVVTTKGALYHLSPSSSLVTCTRLQVRSGMLAGLGRRVTSFFFSSAQDVNVINFIMLHTSSHSPPEAVVLTSSSLQKWHLGSVGVGNGIDQMTAQVDINALLSEPLCQAISNTADAEKEFRIWPLDIVLYSKHNHLALLVAVSDDQNAQNEVRFAICVCPSSVLEEGQSATSGGFFVETFLLDHTEAIRSESDKDAFSYQLLIPNITAACPEQAVIWRDDKIIVKSLLRGTQQHEEILSLDSTGESVLGAGISTNRCVLLTTPHGLLTISPVSSSRTLVSQNIEDSILQTPSSSRPQTPVLTHPNTPIVSKVKIEQLESSDSGAQRLQAAFIHFNRMNITQAKSIVEVAFGGSEGRRSLDNATVFVSQELIDDYPAQDPRWAESVPQDSGNASNSLILLHQLQDKQKAHQLFLDFLIEVGIWDALTMADNSESKGKSYTRWVLTEHGEKLAATIALRQRHAEHQGVVDSAIRKVLERRDHVFDKRGLTPQDVFYREVSRVHDILEGLLDTEEEMIGNSALSSREMFAAIAGVNIVFEVMLSAAHQYRRSNNVSSQDNVIEYAPWTVSSGRHSVREAIIRQHHITFARGLPEAEDGQQRAALHSHLVSLADIVLTDYVRQIDSVKDAPVLTARCDELTASFVQHKTALIAPLLEVGLIDKAADLAEKYHDFSILMELCDRRNDQYRLAQYMTEFASEGFSDFLFKWYLERGMYRKLLECASSQTLAVADYNDRLAEFLLCHPRIAWLHQIETGDFMAAQEILEYLAAMETLSAAKKNHYLSLSKLSAVFSDGTDEVIQEKVESVNNQHVVLRYQETLPGALLAKLRMTVDNMPVFSVQRLIELYAGEENTASHEVDFKKALDLLQFLPQRADGGQEEMEELDLPDVEGVKHFIWCQAILKDSWEDIDQGTNPLEACSHTVLSKTLGLVQNAGVLAECLPDVERLLEAEELGPIRESASSQYLIRAKFEQFHRLLAATGSFDHVMG